MQATLLKMLINAWKLLLLAALLALLNMLLSTGLAIQANLPTRGGSPMRAALWSWLTNDTSISPETGYLLIFALLTFLATRPKRVGTAGVFGLLLMAAAEIIFTARHVAVVPPDVISVLVTIIRFVAAALVLLFGSLTLVQSWRLRRQVVPSLPGSRPGA